MGYKLMIQGTMSNAGKSFLVTGLCRLFSNMGYRVAPFKSQNMALNSGVTADGYEMGRAQIVQAEAARTIPDVRMNPILLKPNSDVGSQVIVMGRPIGNMKAREYYEYKPQLIPVIKEAFASLEREYDLIIVEGAGSPAEINLKENDIVNMGLAKMLDLPVLLAGDIDLGGVFAQLLGTLEWLEPDEKDRIKGLIINKFRGDVTLLKPGIDMLTSRCGKEVIGVVPFVRAHIDEEDSVTIAGSQANIFRKLECYGIHDTKDDGRAEELNTDCDSSLASVSEKSKASGTGRVIEKIKIYVIRLPHMSNFTDFTPLGILPGVEVKYISKVPQEYMGIADTGIADTETADIDDGRNVDSVKNKKCIYHKEIPDLIIIPGTKCTISDLRWMKENGLADYILSQKDIVPIMGICGGNQILGNSISDPEGIEGITKEYSTKEYKVNEYSTKEYSTNKYKANVYKVKEENPVLTKSTSEEMGLGLLNQDTIITKEKTLLRKLGKLICPEGFFSCLNNCEYEGYEIHSGVTNEAVAKGDVFGTYLHGIFDRADVTKALIKGLLERRQNNAAENTEKNTKTNTETNTETTTEITSETNTEINTEINADWTHILDNITDYSNTKDGEYDKIAKSLEDSLDMDRLKRICGM